MALLEADVNFKVVKQFTKSVQERAVGQDVMNGLNPGQMVIKIVNEELVNLMGSETTELPMKPGNEITVLMMAGLQGAGKTTTVAKLAGAAEIKGKTAAVGGMRRLSTRSDHPASDQRREAGRRGFLHGRQAKACRYRKGGH